MNTKTVQYETVPPDGAPLAKLREPLALFGALWARSPHRLRPTEAALQAWDGFLDAWVGSDLPLILRNARRRHERDTCAQGREVIFADNSVASWALALALAGQVPDLPSWMSDNIESYVPLSFVARGPAMHGDRMPPTAATIERPTRFDPYRAPPPDEVAQRHSEIVTAELTEIDAHYERLEFRISALASHPRSFELQELRAELSRLGTLRQEIATDKPITVTRDGVPRWAASYAAVLSRAKQLKEDLWAAAKRDAGSGNHREARNRRHDALRARLIAEYELGLRTSLRG